jgi:hypothetical protein
MRTFIALVSLLASACTSSAPAAPIGTCAAAWNDTAAWALRLAHEPSNRLGSLADLTLVESSARTDATDDFAVGVAFTKDARYVEGEAKDDDASFDASVSRNFYRARRIQAARMEMVPTTVSVKADEQARWRKVVEGVHRAQRLGAVRVQFWFSRAGAVQRPGWAWVDVDVSTAFDIAGDERVSHYGSVASQPSDQLTNLRRVLAPCTSLAARVNDSVRDIALELGKESDDCRCQVNQRSLRALLWAMHPADEITAHSFSLEGEHAMVVEAPGDATWAQVAPQLLALPHGVPLELRVK